MNLRQRIDEVFLALGSPQHRKALDSIEEPFIHQARWQCGCIVEYVDENVGAFEWRVCSNHGWVLASRADAMASSRPFC
jgi:hypothetical protein